jgi:hypothetical protein
MKRKNTHGIKRSGKESQYEGSTGSNGDGEDLPMDGDEIVFDNKNDEFPDKIDFKKGQPRKFSGDELFETPEDDVVNLVGEEDRISDAAAAIRALLGQGGDYRAASEIDDNQVRALLVLLDVAEELNSPRLLKTAENFLMLRISAGGKGRAQVVGAFKGLYEPNNQPQMGGQMPTGSLRGVQ